MSVLRTIQLILTVSLALFFMRGFAAADPKPEYRLEVSRQLVTHALKEFAHQTKLQVVYYTDVAEGIESPGANGSMSVEEALTKILSGTGLEFIFLNERTIAIQTATPAPGADSSRTPPAPQAFNISDALDSGTAKKPGFWGRFRLAQSDQSSSLRTSDSGEQEENPPRSSDRNSEGRVIEEVVVTGTHIRGANSSASPIHSYERDEIALTGLGSVQEFLQRLPWNFGGGASEDTIADVTGGGAGNVVGGTGVNLRGLGSDSTLILINGHRIAPGNIYGNFVDTSLIPLNGVERIDVMPDGASAIYGSDAVGGVVNLVMRKEVESAETQVRYGSVTSGDSDELQLGQTFGGTWDGGSALLAYEYYDRTPLEASDRPYTRNVTEPFTLLGKQERHGAFASVRHAPLENLQLYADGLYSKRSSRFDAATAFFAQRTTAEIEAYSTAIGATAALSDRLSLEVGGTYGVSETDQLTVNVPSNTQASHRLVDSDVLSTEIKIDGELFGTGAGQVKFALGGQYRKEKYDQSNPINAAESFENDRNVLAGFVEVRVPLIAGETSLDSRLELTLADRYEHYSDFGNTNNPKFGVIFRPTPGFNFRGTYGTSFKAPILNDLNSTPTQIVPFPLPDPSVGGTTNVVILFGGNPTLDPQEAKTWSVGADLLPSAASGVRASVTYFNTKYDGRIATPDSSVGLFDALGGEDILGPEIIRRNPSSGEVAALAAMSSFSNPFAIDLATIGAIVDYRTHNLSSVETSGIDFSLSKTTGLSWGEIELGIDGVWLLDFDSQVTPTAPVSDILNTPYNPVDVRLRTYGVLKRGPATFSVFVNYTDSYEDKRASSAGPVDSWTTADIAVSYGSEQRSGPLGNITASIGAINVTDEEPPFVANPIFGVSYDGANANALGRFVYIQLSKSW